VHYDLFTELAKAWQAQFKVYAIMLRKIKQEYRTDE